MKTSTFRNMKTIAAMALALAASFSQAPAQAESFGTRLKAGEVMRAGDTMQSPNGQYILVMQGDGNLVTYVRGGKAIWTPNAPGGLVPGRVAVMQHDCNLVTYDQGRGIWGSGAHPMSKRVTPLGNQAHLYPACFLTLSDNGQLKIYAGKTPDANISESILVSYSSATGQSPVYNEGNWPTMYTKIPTAIKKWRERYGDWIQFAFTQPIATSCSVPGWANNLVPDKYSGSDDEDFVYDGEFSRACEAHDLCYESPWDNRDEGKRFCDGQFHDDMKQACNDYHNNGSPAWMTCRSYAGIMYKALHDLGVMNKGLESYRNGQKRVRFTLLRP